MNVLLFFFATQTIAYSSMNFLTVSYCGKFIGYLDYSQKSNLERM